MKGSQFKPTVKPQGRNGLAIGWRLAISTAVILIVVMGGISVSQQMASLKRENAIHENLLRESLSPLIAQLENAKSFKEMQTAITELHNSRRNSHAYRHSLVITDTAGVPVLSMPPENLSSEPGNTLDASLPFHSSLLTGGEGKITVSLNSEEYRGAARREWVLWGIHLISTIIAVSLFLGIATYFLITKPVHQLIRSVRKMERGYWTPVDPGGAWEIRWLAWRFSNMAKEVYNSAARLTRAERKAWSLMAQWPGCEDETEKPESAHTEDGGPALIDTPEYERLDALCRKLEEASSSDPAMVSLAFAVSESHALEAGRLGFYDLKARLEDAALRLFDPGSFAVLSERLDAMRADWGLWAVNQRSVMLDALERRKLTCVRLLHRVKHTAGVHSKMRGKDLDLEEIHDLFAFRIVVPTETDCYAALGVIHQLYEAEVSRFKDYVAEPKENGYQALHTCVRSEGAPLFEIQIRSIAMDRFAERGQAVHWQYKANQNEIHDPRFSSSVQSTLWQKFSRWSRKSEH